MTQHAHVLLHQSTRHQSTRHPLLSLTHAYPPATRTPGLLLPLARNGAISGTPSMYLERVITSRLDPGVDLVLLEYAVNNKFNHTTMEYEDVGVG
jgi:hypothetical protein